MRCLKYNNIALKKLSFGLALSAAIVLGGCQSSDNTDTATTGTELSLDLELPSSLTGSSQAVTSNLRSATSSTTIRSVGEPCAYQGADDEDPFQNGYRMSKFMISAVATWTCIADTLIEVAAHVPHDGEIYETENDLSSDIYEDDEPTHYSVIDDSVTQTTVRLYYGYDRSTPPSPGDDAQFFISWDERVQGNFTGRLIIDATSINLSERKEDDPVAMRMDFNFNQTQKLADMFLRFDNNNEWAKGMRIEVSRDLTAHSLAR